MGREGVVAREGIFQSCDPRNLEFDQPKVFRGPLRPHIPHIIASVDLGWEELVVSTEILSSCLCRTILSGGPSVE